LYIPHILLVRFLTQSKQSTCMQHGSLLSWHAAAGRRPIEPTVDGSAPAGVTRRAITPTGQLAPTSAAVTGPRFRRIVAGAGAPPKRRGVARRR
jgi:hypothetical protein